MERNGVDGDTVKLVSPVPMNIVLKYSALRSSRIYQYSKLVTVWLANTM